MLSYCRCPCRQKLLTFFKQSNKDSTLNRQRLNTIHIVTPQSRYRIEIVLKFPLSNFHRFQFKNSRRFTLTFIMSVAIDYCHLFSGYRQALRGTVFVRFRYVDPVSLIRYHAVRLFVLTTTAVLSVAKGLLYRHTTMMA